MVLEESITGTGDEDSGRPSIDFPGANTSIETLKLILIEEETASGNGLREE
jgi:hypothetical protein